MRLQKSSSASTPHRRIYKNKRMLFEFDEGDGDDEDEENECDDEDDY